MKKVIKRDGNKQDFNVEKIKKAIKKASNSLEKEYQIPDEEIQEMAESISFEIADSNEIDIEKIQDLVEKELMEKLQQKEKYLYHLQILNLLTMLHIQVSILLHIHQSTNTKQVMM